MTFRILAMLRVVEFFICSKRDSRFLHLASQNSISTMGPGLRPSSSSLSHSMLRTSSTFSDTVRSSKLQHQTHLMSPFYDDPLDVVLHQEVDVLAVALPDLNLLILDVTGGSLGEREESLALDVASDLVHCRGQLVYLPLDVCREVCKSVVLTITSCICAGEQVELRRQQIVHIYHLPHTAGI